ncbi:AAA family ATPase [Brevibacillus sp. 179-C9.3 HS]|uniref:AAA family ATPase n=1 Tax=unclassified Brevibacillus TaxID=2684853 RepID=UPI0039A15A5A
MSKRSKKNFQAPKQDNQPTKQDNVQRLLAQQREEAQKILQKDERVLIKIQEYEQLMEELEKEYSQKREEVQAEYTEKSAALRDEKDSFQKQKEQMIEAIRNDEEQIRSSYRDELALKWETEFQEKQKQSHDLLTTAREEAERLLTQAKLEVGSAMEEAHRVKVEAEHTRITLLDETRKQIEQRYRAISDEYDQKLAELMKKETEYKKWKLELELQEEDIEYMKLEFQSKKASLEDRAAKFSPLKVEELQGELESMQELKEVDKETIRQLKTQVSQLKQLLPEDEERSIDTILSELDAQKRENNSLRDRLAQLPSTEELVRLRASSETLDNLNRVLDEERRKRRDAEMLADNLSIGVMELEQAKKTAETLKTLNAQLRDELGKINDVYKQSSQSKFPGLHEIDLSLLEQAPFRPMPSNKDLEGLVKYMRAYGAEKKGLYYSERMIRAFIASLAASKLLILQGLSGTGKSSLPRLFQEALGAENSLVPVQPSWRDNRELLGYDNDFTKRFKETEFTKFVYTASAPTNRNKIWFIVLDEMNLARIEYYFADFLSVMEKDPEYWTIPLISANDDSHLDQRPKYLVDQGKSLFITQNIWFIGTANRDESTFGITDKVYDRAQILDFKHREEPFSAQCSEKIALSYDEFFDLIEAAQTNATNDLRKSDWEKIALLDEYMRDKLDITFGNRIKAQIEKFVPVYVACGGSKMEALDHLFAHKVLRKLEGRYETYLKDSLKELIELIESEFGRGEFMESISLIEQKIQRLGG